MGCSKIHLVVKRDQLHVVLEHIHYFVQFVRGAQRKRKQHIVAVELRFFHRRHIEQLRKLQGDECHEVIIKMS